jgi:isopentenyl diphosphate isomerase/L-lactate dehydrogenase-like FMN-dependent dehydrogenase
MIDHPRYAERSLARRAFLRWLAVSPLGLSACALLRDESLCEQAAHAVNVFELEAAGRRSLGEDASAYLAGGAEDLRTVRANRRAFVRRALRARRLVDVRVIDTSLSLLGEALPSPILLAPVGFQKVFHPEAEAATARAARARGQRMILSSVSNLSVGAVASAAGVSPWFQLYPTEDRTITAALLERALRAGCRVVVLTVDTPVIGNREMHADFLATLLAAGEMPIGSMEGIRTDEPINDPSMTWDMIDWLRGQGVPRVVLKGIVTAEDARLAVDHGADGLIVSNHGGRQLESSRATLDCLPEITTAVDGRMPVLLDGGVRRGTDVLKALALGADAVAIGRPYCWGLAAFGQAGVERALEILQRELVLSMQLLGVTRLADLDPSHVADAS